MDFKKIRFVSFILFLAGVSFLLSQFQGVSGFVVGDGESVLNLGVVIILLAFILFALASRLKALEEFKEPLFYDGSGSVRGMSGKVNATALRKQKFLRKARERFIDLYAKDPNQKELELFIERLTKEGRLKEIENTV